MPSQLRPCCSKANPNSAPCGLSLHANVRRGKRLEGWVTHPVMARHKEMVSPSASIPVGVLVWNNTDVVSDQVLERVPGIGVGGLVHQPYNICYAYWKEEGVGLIGMPCRERALPALHLIDELTFYWVDAATRPIVDERWLPFSICPHLESPLHLNVASEVDVQAKISDS